MAKFNSRSTIGKTSAYPHAYSVSYIPSFPDLDSQTNGPTTDNKGGACERLPLRSPTLASTSRRSSVAPAKGIGWRVVRHKIPKQSATHSRAGERNAGHTPGLGVGPAHATGRSDRSLRLAHRAYGRPPNQLGRSKDSVPEWQATWIAVRAPSEP